MSTSTSHLIEAVVDKYDDELIELRRDIHQHPELAWEEARTSDLAAHRVEQAGSRVTRMPRSGFFAELGEGKRVVALRADMDALPIPDRTDDPWRSTVPDITHACGHDVHVSAMVGTALALAEVHERGELRGTVRLLFQPAEEVMPGGAKHLIAQGALEGVERVFALHCDPGVDVGKIGLRAGALTSAADRIEVWLEGTGGHTSRPPSPAT